MKYAFYSFFFLAILLFVSCDKSESFKDEYEDKEDFIDDEGYCFDFVYPLTYIFPDNSTTTGSEAALDEAVKNWYEAHPDAAAEFSYQFPLDIVFENGETQTINHEETLKALEIDCKKDELKECEWDDAKVSDTTIWEEHIVEPLVTSEECGDCIVDGIVKYVKIDTEFAYVIYYGKGECDQWAYLVTYFEEEDKKVEKCKFKLACDTGN